ncbi:GntP family permease [Amycolatopsis orientalis]|uniref:GntP family permease n=1 Tax=Amycolatopsis orientalis TaxID=31958 RepID=UPI0003A5961B|nr:gluconate:H+ symporter [Amycolatopsis orientalis]
MTAHTWPLLLVLAAAIAVLLLLINSRLRFHPFVALIVVSVAAGLAAGEPLSKLPGSIEDGAGGTLGSIGIPLALGAMLGRLLSEAGATDAIAKAVLARSGPRSLPWLVTGAAVVIGIPMFFEVGLIVLLPLIFSIAQRLDDEGGTHGSPYLLLGVPAIAALSTLHGTLVPHPGPLTAQSGLHANLGLTIVVGLVCAIPAIIVSGPLYARWIAPRLPQVRPSAALVEQFTSVEPKPARTGSGPQSPSAADSRRGPSAGFAFAAVLVPVGLMLLRTLAELTLAPTNPARKILTFTGEPILAMLAGFLVVLAGTVSPLRARGVDVREALTDSLRSIAGIMLIIAGGGAFNQVLKDSGIGKAIAAAATGAHLNLIVLGWLLALLLSASTGSATVGIVSATGIVAPLAGAGGSLQTSLLVIAIGAGSIGLNYVNHAGFWLVKESFGMSLSEATKTHTVVQTLVSVLGLGMALLVWAVAG